MEAAGKDKIIERFQGEEPEIFDIEHVTGYDDFPERLAEAEQDYREACEAFLQTHPGQESIMKAAENAEQAARVLYSRVQVIFLMSKSTKEQIDHAHKILDMLDYRNGGVGTCWMCGPGVYGLWFDNEAAYLNVGKACD